MMMKQIFLLIALLQLIALAGATEANVSQVSEQCGKWTVSFGWPDGDGYSKSVSHADNEDNKARIYTDTLTLKSEANTSKTIKISVMRYSKWNYSLAEQSNLMNLANNTLIKSGSCRSARVVSKKIDGKPGVFASGSECKSGKILYAAVYPVDGSSPAVASSVLAIMLSTYDLESTDRVLNSLHIG